MLARIKSFTVPDKYCIPVPSGDVSWFLVSTHAHNCPTSVELRWTFAINVRKRRTWPNSTFSRFAPSLPGSRGDGSKHRFQMAPRINTALRAAGRSVVCWVSEQFLPVRFICLEKLFTFAEKAVRTRELKGPRVFLCRLLIFIFVFLLAEVTSFVCNRPCKRCFVCETERCRVKKESEEKRNKPSGKNSLKTNIRDALKRVQT